MTNPISSSSHSSPPSPEGPRAPKRNREEGDGLESPKRARSSTSLSDTESAVQDATATVWLAISNLDEGTKALCREFEELSNRQYETLTEIAEIYQNKINQLMNPLPATSDMISILSSEGCQHSLRFIYKLSQINFLNRFQFIAQSVKYLVYNQNRNYSHFFEITGIDLATSEGEQMLRDLFSYYPNLLFDFFLRQVDDQEEIASLSPDFLKELNEMLKLFSNYLPKESYELVQQREDDLFHNRSEFSVANLQKALMISDILNTGFVLKLESLEIDEKNWAVLSAVAIKSNLKEVELKCQLFIKSYYNISVDMSSLFLVTIEINDESTQDFLNQYRLHQLSEIIKVELRPRGDFSLEQIIQFLEIHQDVVRVLDLTKLGDVVDGEFLLSLTSRCSNIKKLVIETNELTGGDLECLSKLTELTTLVLNCPNVSSIPASFGRLVNLQTLRLHSPKEMSHELANLKKLSDLSFIDNVNTNLLFICMKLFFPTNIKLAESLLNKLKIAPYRLNILHELLFSGRWEGQDQLWDLLISTHSVYIPNVLDLFVMIPESFRSNLMEIILNKNIQNVSIMSLCRQNQGVLSKIRNGLSQLTYSKFKILNEQHLEKILGFDGIQWDPQVFFESVLCEKFCEDSNVLFVFNNLLWAKKDYLHSYFEHNSPREWLIRLKQKYSTSKLSHHINNIILNYCSPNQPGNALLYPININDEIGIRLSYYHPVEMPVETLLAIQYFFDNYELDHFEIAYFDQEGVDGGALRRDCLSRTFDALAKKFNLRTKMLEMNEENRKLVYGIASLLNGLTDFSYPIPIGETFHPDFYKWMLAFSFKQLTVDFDELSEKELFELTFKMNENDPHSGEFLSKLKLFFEWNFSDILSVEEAAARCKLIEEIADVLGCDVPKGMIHVVKMEAFRETVLQEFNNSYRNRWHAMHIIAKEFMPDIEAYNEYASRDPEWLRVYIEGEFDRTRLREMIVFNEGASDEISGEFLRWIDRKSDEELRRFLACVTGSPTLPSNDAINVNLFNTVTIPQIQSCANEIRLPSTISTEDLVIYLDSWASDVDRHFDRA